MLSEYAHAAKIPHFVAEMTAGFMLQPINAVASSCASMHFC